MILLNKWYYWGLCFWPKTHYQINYKQHAIKAKIQLYTLTLSSYMNIFQWAAMCIFVLSRVLTYHNLSVPHIKVKLAFISLTKVNMLTIINQCWMDHFICLLIIWLYIWYLCRGSDSSDFSLAFNTNNKTNSQLPPKVEPTISSLLILLWQPDRFSITPPNLEACSKVQVLYGEKEILGSS